MKKDLEIALMLAATTAMVAACAVYIHSLPPEDTGPKIISWTADVDDEVYIKGFKYACSSEFYSRRDYPGDTGRMRGSTCGHEFSDVYGKVRQIGTGENCISIYGVDGLGRIGYSPYCLWFRNDGVGVVKRAPVPPMPNLPLPRPNSIEERI
ncbi:hypothetical protein JQ625_28290 [Bradyrhizobium diazoefficiens]|nr:hypothetical protein [Bradyrhizobium diazoefficiens]MBR0778745.1 hypothetical protein [Bradyrhizobium diazoefficiens]